MQNVLPLIQSCKQCAAEGQWMSVRKLLTENLRYLDQCTTNDLAQILTTLQPSEDTELSICLLNVIASHTTANSFPLVVNYFMQVTNYCKPSLEEAVFEDLHCLALRLSNISIEILQPLATVPPLRTLCSKTADGKEMIPRFVALFLKSCTLSKAYSVGNRFIHHKKLALKLVEKLVDPSDVLMSYYYAAVIQIAMKDYSRAFEFLRLLFSVPTTVVSDVTVDAYKKYILVSLIVKGTVEPLGKFVGVFLQRQLKISCSEYMTFAKEFAERNVDKLQHEMENHRSAFEQDLHWGLVKQVFKSFKRNGIQNLTRTFLTLSLDDIAKQLTLSSSQEAEQLLLDMIVHHEITAEIDQRASMVRLEECTEKEKNRSHSSAEMIPYEIDFCLTLHDELLQFYQNLVTDPNLILRELQHGEEEMDHSFC